MRSAFFGLFSLLTLLTLTPGTAPGVPVPEPGKPANGVYVLLFEGDGRRITLPGGADAVLGKRLDHGTGTAGELRSVSNDNSQFQFTIKKLGPLPESVTKGQTALVVDGVIMHLERTEARTAVGMLDTRATVYSAEAARTLAAHYRIKPELRRHPGHRLVARWSPDKAAYKPGEPVMLKLEIENVGDNPIRFQFGGKQRGARNNQFRFLAQGEGGYGKGPPDTGDFAHFGGRCSLQTLKPNEVFTETVDVTKWFKFTEPGRYRITGLLEMPMSDPDAVEFGSVIWDELAVGECTIRVIGK